MRTNLEIREGTRTAAESSFEEKGAKEDTEASRDDMTVDVSQPSTPHAKGGVILRFLQFSNRTRGR